MADSFGDRIRKARLNYGMSQAELARRSGISKNAMNEIETNKTLNPGALQVKAIARALRVRADYILGMDDDEEDVESQFAGAMV
jgi:transcriptional regulator with XRE-family HTH domain